MSRDKDSRVALQLAYLLIVYGAVLMDGRSSGFVQMRFIHLIDDLDKFKSIPWGRVSYKILVTRAHQAKDRIHSMDGTKTRACEAPRFVDVLQVWAYEICEGIASYCAMKVDPNIVHRARILRWTSQKRSSFDELYKFFLAGSGYQPVLINLTDDEKGMLVQLGVIEMMRVANPVPVNRVPRVMKRKMDNNDEGNVIRSFPRLNQKWEINCEKKETKLPIVDGETIQSIVKVHFSFKTKCDKIYVKKVILGSMLPWGGVQIK